LDADKTSESRPQTGTDSTAASVTDKVPELKKSETKKAVVSNEASSEQKGEAIIQVSKDQMEKQIKEKNNELVKEYLGQGSFVYELYGIMIHSGGAHGGHYSAYIKDFES